MVAQPRIADLILHGSVAHVVSDTVHFDRQVRPRAKEVENIISRAMLLAKVETIWRTPQLSPKQNFGQ